METNIKLYSQQQRIRGNPHDVFAFMDDLAKTGMHMTKRSWMMMGSKLTLEEISGKHKGVGSAFRWFGKMMGMEIDFTETVTEWKQDQSKKWETLDGAKIILFSWYQMGFEIELAPNGHCSDVTLWIKYKKPVGWFDRLLSFFFARFYCRWCLDSMLRDTKQHIESMVHTPYAIATSHML